MVILGIDPGSRITGFGIIDNQVNSISYMHSGSITIVGDSLPEKLGNIFNEISAVIREYQPEQMSIESVFMSKNADSALKLGQARGAAICAGYQAGLKIAEYAPREIKQALVGKGAASKQQVAHMVQRLLRVNHDLKSDEADGLAIAICHAQHYATAQKTGIHGDLLKRRGGRRR